MARTLDDPNYIKQIDTEDFLSTAAGAGQGWLHETELKNMPNLGGCGSVVVCGMGGAAQAADLMKSIAPTSVPLVIVSDYDIPSWVSNTTYVIASSYSGNTEEVLSCLDQARQRTSMLSCVSHGGKASEIARQHAMHHIELPTLVQPRMSLPVSFRVVHALLTEARLAKDSYPFEKMAINWAQQADHYAASINTTNNLAKKIALDMLGTTPIIYSSSQLRPVAYLWKTLINESAKSTAWTGTYPEFSHNEFIGWTMQPQIKAFSVIDLRSSFENTRTSRRFDLSQKLLSGRRPSPIIIEGQGDSPIEQASYLSCLGVHVAAYLAIAYGINPTPLVAVDKLKVELG